MPRSCLAAALALVALAAAADPALAGQTRRKAPVCVDIDIMRVCRGAVRPGRAPQRARGALIRKLRGMAVTAPRGRPWPSSGVSALVGPLASKVAEIEYACGSRLISAVRHSLIAGTRLLSLHAFGRAADVAGNPACIYGTLAGWQGGYSVDYGSVGHVHISWDPGGREWGARFVHGGRRHARRHRQHAR
jgi:hypothetical protein